MKEFKISTANCRHLFLWMYPDRFHFVLVEPTKDASHDLKDRGHSMCRETLTRTVRNRIMALSSKSSLMLRARMAAYPGVSVNRLARENCDLGKDPKALACLRKKLKKYTEKTISLVNLLESEHGWPLTKAYPAICPKAGLPMTYFVGSSRWLISPYMFSLWTMLLRTQKDLNYHKDISGVKNLDQLTHLIFKIVPASERNASTQVREVMPYCGLLMKNYKQLFPDTRKGNWSQWRPYQAPGEGVFNLVRGISPYTLVQKRFNYLRNLHKRRLMKQ